MKETLIVKISGLEISLVGYGELKKYKPYLRFGNVDGRYVGSIDHKATLKKLRKMVDRAIKQTN